MIKTQPKLRTRVQPEIRQRKPLKSILDQNREAMILKDEITDRQAMIRAEFPLTNTAVLKIQAVRDRLASLSK